MGRPRVHPARGWLVDYRDFGKLFERRDGTTFNEGNPTRIEGQLFSTPIAIGVPERSQPSGDIRMKRLVLIAHYMWIVLFLGGTAAAGEPIRMVWLPVTQALPFFVALEEGLFEKRGLSVEQTKMQNPTQIIDALVSGRADVGPGGSATAIAAIAEAQFQGAFKVFGLQGGRVEQGFLNDSLIVKAGSPIKGFNDLSGKKLAILPGAQWRTLAKLILKKHSIVPDKEVQLVEVALPLHSQAVIAGTVDAALTVEPAASLAEATGEVVRVVANPAARFVVDPFFGGASLITTTFLSKRPEDARSLIAAMDEATDLVTNGFDRYKHLFKKYLGLPEQSLTQVKPVYFRSSRDLSGETEAAFSALIGQFKSEGVIKSDLNPASMLLGGR